MISGFYKKKFKDYKDSGFGTGTGTQGGRFINKDGSFNVHKRGGNPLQRLSTYRALIRMSWWKFMGNVLIFYILVNFFFAFIYIIIGTDHLGGASGTTPTEKFLDAFFFSTQTLATVGYGRINPIGIAVNFVAAVESLVGLLSFALATSLLYARFSRPVAKIIFSDNMLVAPYQGGQGLMFRMANAKNNQLTDAEIQVLLSLTVNENDNKVRRFYQLKLERDKINFLALSWTVVHPLDEESPLFGYSETDLRESDAEFMIPVKGFDDTYEQTVHTRHSYKYYEVVWNARFMSMYRRSENSEFTVLELDKIGVYEKI